MPTYSYACQECGHAFDIRQSFTDDSLTVCPECGEPRLRKVIHPVGIAFKGSGFYKTDSRAAAKSRPRRRRPATARARLERRIGTASSTAVVRLVVRLELVRLVVDAVERRRPRRRRRRSTASSSELVVHSLLTLGGRCPHPRAYAVRPAARARPRLARMTTEQTTAARPRRPGRARRPTVRAPRSASSAGPASTTSSTTTRPSRSTPRSGARATLSSSVRSRARGVAFVARHGKGHRFAPHRVNYRANLWALRAVGVRQILSPCAVGSLKPEHGPGTIVVPDQVVDRTWGRAHTIYEAEGPVVHVGFADPYCPNGRQVAVDAAAALRARRSSPTARSSSSTGPGSPPGPSRSCTSRPASASSA